VAKRLHLHARRIMFPHPREGVVDVTAPLPDHMIATFESFGFDSQRFDD
jgi:23S rRNA pseudouridine955/2504/2580 synthase